MFQSFITFMILLLLIDSIWVLGARKIHSQVVESVQKAPLNPDLLPAALFYVMVPFAYVLIIKKLAKTKVDALLYGMLVGMLMYGTFDLTNKAIFKDYPWSYTIADMSWGTICVGVVSLLTFSFGK
jgi:uncharacterized membrane protein